MVFILLIFHSQRPPLYGEDDGLKGYLISNGTQFAIIVFQNSPDYSGEACINQIGK